MNDSDTGRSTVFVVHGRNLTAKNALVTFLRTLGLQPLEWEQARSLTALASPSTLEIVKAGIENATCVVVLMTGDDLAVLHPQFGAEEPALQPRPNVIFEAGWAFATALPAKTVLVRMGEVRGLSDLDGINYLTLDNTPVARNALKQRLFTAGCRIDNSASDYLSPEAGGDFSVAAPSPIFSQLTDLVAKASDSGQAIVIDSLSILVNIEPAVPQMQVVTADYVVTLRALRDISPRDQILSGSMVGELSGVRVWHPGQTQGPPLPVGSYDVRLNLKRGETVTKMFRIHGSRKQDREQPMERTGGHTMLLPNEATEGWITQTLMREISIVVSSRGLALSPAQRQSLRLKYVDGGGNQWTQLSAAVVEQYATDETSALRASWANVEPGEWVTLLYSWKPRGGRPPLGA